MSYASQVLPTMRSTTFILDTFILSTIAISVASIGSSPSASEQDISTADFQVPGISVRDFDQSQVKSSETSPQHRDKVFPEKRYLRSSASEQDLVKSKESVQLDDVSQGQESLIGASAAGGDSSSSEERGRRILWWDDDDDDAICYTEKENQRINDVLIASWILGGFFFIAFIVVSILHCKNKKKMKKMKKENTSIQQPGQQMYAPQSGQPTYAPQPGQPTYSPQPNRGSRCTRRNRCLRELHGTSTKKANAETDKL